MKQKRNTRPVITFLAISVSILLSCALLTTAISYAATSKKAHTQASTKEFSNLQVTSAQSTLHNNIAYTSPIITADNSFNAIGANLYGRAQDQSQIAIEIKVLEGNTWSTWQPLTISEDWKNNQAESIDAARGAFTDLLFTKNATHAQFRLSFPQQKHIAQAEINKIKLVFINSSQGPTINPATGKQTSRIFAPIASVVSSLTTKLTAHATTVDDTFKPAVVTRQEWGADPALMTWTPEYKTPASKIILHHTAGVQGGSDSAAVIRGIYYYHAVVRQWGDIGYNYLVDERGTVFEGRYGGDNVTGAHTYGFNTGTVGISVLGDYEQDQPSAELISGVSRLAGYVSYKNGLIPTGNGVINGADKKNIAGHRDYDATLCPGTKNYTILDTFRQQASDYYNTIVAQSGGESAAYAAQLVSIDWPDIIGVNQRVKVTARFQNTGYETWHNSFYPDTKYRDFIALDTQSPSQRTSSLRDASTWTDRVYRAGKLKEASVAPQEIGTVEFYLKAPDMPGIYTEKFGLISEFNTTVQGGAIEKTITVDTTFHAKLIYTNMPTAMKAGWLVPVTLVYKNTGRSAWINNGSKFIALNINKPIGSTSKFANSRWIAAYRPAKLIESRVNPGQNGHLVVWLKAPSTPGTYKFNASLVAEYFTWMPDSQINAVIRVDK